MAVIKCKMCGSNMPIAEGVSIAECEYCGSIQTVPAADNEKKLTLFNRANRLRFGCEFDKAAGVYEAIVADFPEEAEAYWGLVLCKYGIEYVDDPASGKKIPTCHRSSFESVQDDSNFEQALENTDIAARTVYRGEAKAIEELRKGIIEVSSKEDPYDIFICYKESVDGNRTMDSVLAQDLYDALTEKGYRVFFSRITLEDKLGQEYEPYIFAALNSAKVMLVVGTDYEHFNAVWVRNEWSRFLELIAKGKKKTLIPCFKGITAYDMPKEFAKLQAQDLGKVGAVQDLLRGIDKLIDPAATASVQQAGIDVSSLLERADQALEEGDWEAASNRYSLALVADAECAEAHLGQLKAERKVKVTEDLAKCKKRLDKSVHYKEVMRSTDGTLKELLESYNRQIIVRHQTLCARVAITAVAVVALITVFFLVALPVNYSDAVAKFESGQSVSDMSYWFLCKFPDYKDSRNYAASIAISNSDLMTAANLHPDRLILDQAGLKTLNNNRSHYFWHQYEYSIVLANGVTEIHDRAFCEMYGLEEIVIPASVQTIGEAAFKNCDSLQKVTFEGSLSVVGDEAFFGCRSLTEIAISGNDLVMGEYAFRDCTSLEQVVFEGLVSEIGIGAFQNCTSMVSIQLPGSIEIIKASVFVDCISLQEIVIPKRVTAINGYAFRGCLSLKNVLMSEGVQWIGKNAFENCMSMESIVLPRTLEMIFEEAFKNSGLTEIVIPADVKTVHSGAFSGCRDLRNIYCRAAEAKDGWKSDWADGCDAQIHWGAHNPAA